MLKIVGIITLVLCCIGVFLKTIIAPTIKTYGQLELSDKEQKDVKRGYLIYNIALLGLIALSFILNYLAYN